MKDFKKLLADKIKSGQNVALYCYGIFASHMIFSLEKFYGVLPAVVIDNDEKKRGVAEFDIPVMPFEEARERYEDLQYFICTDDFKYSIIGDMLEKGVAPESIINYVPVEKKRSCLYFTNRLMPTVTANEDKSHVIAHCNDDSCKSEYFSSRIPAGSGGYEEMQEIMNLARSNFQCGTIEACSRCPLNREQYMVSETYDKPYKQLVFYHEDYRDCIAHCVYCCNNRHYANKKLGMKNESSFRWDRVDEYKKFLSQILSLDKKLDDDFSCAIDMSERDLDKKIGFCIDNVEEAGLTPLVYKVSSCLLTYGENLAELMRRGKVYVIWSLDAGTRETYRKIKQIDAFDHVLKTVERYIAEDLFHGKFIVAKYLIVRGINDREEEFDAFLDIVKRFELSYVSISFDFNVDADEDDLEFIRNCNAKAEKAGLKLTYTNTIKQISQALHTRTILSQ